MLERRGFGVVLGSRTRILFALVAFLVAILTVGVSAASVRPAPETTPVSAPPPTTPETVPPLNPVRPVTLSAAPRQGGVLTSITLTGDCGRPVVRVDGLLTQTEEATSGSSFVVSGSALSPSGRFTLANLHLPGFYGFDLFTEPGVYYFTAYCTRRNPNPIAADLTSASPPAPFCLLQVVDDNPIDPAARCRATSWDTWWWPQNFVGANLYGASFIDQVVVDILALESPAPDLPPAPSPSPSPSPKTTTTPPTEPATTTTTCKKGDNTC
ncbi:MAG: hypothetical protein EXQ79_08570 [Acidimicrobiia bacterium]|nr:hypothetical protein [Acidimicrobiia bacterium]